MKKYILIFTSFFILVSFFLFSGSKSNSTESTVGSIIYKKSLPPSKKIELQEELKTDNQNIVPSSESQDFMDSDRDYLLWRKISDKIEDEWSKEIYLHCQYVDRENADKLYNSYLKARKEYIAPQETTLLDSLNDLSRLNGESITNENDNLEPEDEQDAFITQLRRIFREHFGYIQTQRKIFLDAHATNH
jgi:hypothetical protein